MSLSNSLLGWFFWTLQVSFWTLLPGIAGGWLVIARQELWNISFLCLIEIEIFAWFLTIISIELTSKWDGSTSGDRAWTSSVMTEFGSYSHYSFIFLILHVAVFSFLNSKNIWGKVTPVLLVLVNLFHHIERQFSFSLKFLNGDLKYNVSVWNVKSTS